MIRRYLMSCALSLTGFLFVIAPTSIVADARVWGPLGSGLGGSNVLYLHVWNGHLIAAGSFSTAGGSPANNIAAWDGAQWTALATGWDSVRGVTTHNGLLTVAGLRPGGANHEIATWDGANWNTLMLSDYYQLASFGGNLYQTGSWTYGPGGIYTGYRLYEHDGVSWTWVYQTFEPANTGPIEFVGTNLFLYTRNEGTVTAYDGTSWSPYGVHGFFGGCVGTANGLVYASGADLGGSLNVAQWNGTSWQTINPGFYDLCGQFNDLIDFDGKLIAGGALDDVYCTVPGRSVLSWDGAVWAAVGGDMNGTVWDLAVYDGALIAAGNFTESEGESTPLIAELGDIPVAIDTPDQPNRLGQNTPNPFNPTTTIPFNVTNNERVSIDVHSADGRLVRTLVERSYGPGAWSTLWDGKDSAGRAMASGVYFYRLRAGSFEQTRKMILLK